jgi:hypothetical protein
MGRANMASEMVFWWSEQHFGALDAFESDYGHGMLCPQSCTYKILIRVRVVHRALAQQSSTILLLAALK